MLHAARWMMSSMALNSMMSGTDLLASKDKYASGQDGQVPGTPVGMQTMDTMETLPEEDELFSERTYPRR